MTTLADANVLLDVFTADTAWEPWSRNALLEALLDGPVVVNPLIYAEVSAAFEDARELDEQLVRLSIARAELPYEAAFPAMRAFLRYRQAGGTRRSPLPDFYIGAHALASGMRLVTRDANRYRTYFPAVEIIAP